MNGSSIKENAGPLFLFGCLVDLRGRSAARSDVGVIDVSIFKEASSMD